MRRIFTLSAGITLIAAATLGTGVSSSQPRSLIWRASAKSVVGEAARGVGGQASASPCSRDGDVRVVVGLLGEVADRVDVKQRVTEVLAGHGPGDLPVGQRPSRAWRRAPADLL